MNCIAVNMVPAETKGISVGSQGSKENGEKFSLILGDLLSDENIPAEEEKTEEPADIDLAGLSVFYFPAVMNMHQENQDIKVQSGDFSGQANNMVQTIEYAMSGQIAMNYSIDTVSQPYSDSMDGQPVKSLPSVEAKQVKQSDTGKPELRADGDNEFDLALNKELASSGVINRSESPTAAKADNNTASVDFSSGIDHRIEFPNINEASSRLMNSVETRRDVGGFFMNDNIVNDGEDKNVFYGTPSYDNTEDAPLTLLQADNKKVPYEDAVSLAANKELIDNLDKTANRLSCEQEDGAVLNTDKEILAKDSMDSIQNPGGSDMQFDFSHYLFNSENNFASEPEKLTGNSTVNPNVNLNDYIDSVSGQFIKYISHSINSGQHELVVELQPEFLGKVNIKLVSGKDGIVAKIKASSNELREVLNLSASQIQESLKSQGIEVKNFELSGFAENLNPDLLNFNDNGSRHHRGSKPVYGGHASGKEKDRADALNYEEIRQGRYNYLA